MQLKGFGIHLPSYELDRLHREIGALRSTTAEQLTRSAYLTDYGLRDQTSNPLTPMDTVRLYPKTNMVEGGPQLAMYRDFIRLGIRENCGITLTEWLDLPWWISQEIKAMAKHITEQKANALNGLNPKNK